MGSGPGAGGAALPAGPAPRWLSAPASSAHSPTAGLIPRVLCPESELRGVCSLLQASRSRLALGHRGHLGSLPRPCAFRLLLSSPPGRWAGSARVSRPWYHSTVVRGHLSQRWMQRFDMNCFSVVQWRKCKGEVHGAEKREQPLLLVVAYFLSFFVFLYLLVRMKL